MKIKKIIPLVLLAVAVSLGWSWFSRPREGAGASETVHAARGEIRSTVSATGVVLPKNRLEVKPPVNGRIEEVRVTEGQQVRAGEILVIMSSTERAALLDAARAQGEEELNHWKQVYKPIPLIAPISGEVIVGTIQPGQAVTTGDAAVVLSDRLIIRAQVDEIDIGKVREGQEAVVSLDAYPDARIPSVADHIYYESKTVNNVTIYLVDLSPETVPSFFRSGMNAHVEFVLQEKPDALLLPVEAIQREKGAAFVWVQEGAGAPVKKPVTLGISDDRRVEVLSGIDEKAAVVLKTKKYVPPRETGGRNPFAPQRRSSNRS
ncbi:MAG: RND transporter [Candidatus Omnitrophica bacterium CG11_big_fil_rev_8_21_14_0_20_64_10]|nr:MAG: RND transporter [Candidatus Omnitrophica bacterium CG11_big_fil_rev_8_21_14_0_20_64_10]